MGRSGSVVEPIYCRRFWKEAGHHLSHGVVKWFKDYLLFACPERHQYREVDAGERYVKRRFVRWRYRGSCAPVAEPVQAAAPVVAPPVPQAAAMDIDLAKASPFLWPARWTIRIVRPANRLEPITDNRI